MTMSGEVRDCATLHPLDVVRDWDYHSGRRPIFHFRV
jgi:hypothetical protein